MENHDIIVFVGLDALRVGVLIGLGSLVGAGLGLAATDLMGQIVKAAWRKMKWGR